MGALGSEGLMLRYLGRPGESLDKHTEQLGVARELGDKSSEGVALHGLGTLAGLTGDTARAQRCFEESLSLCRETGDVPGVIDSLRSLSQLFACVGRHRDARAAAAEADALARRIGLE